MLYLIGGVPRVGKSTIANLILERDKISYLDIDWIVHMLMHAAPQLDVKVYEEFNAREFKTKAVKFYPFLYQLIKYNQPVVKKFVMEGDSILPEQIPTLQNDFEVRACFLGASKLKPEILLSNPGINNWWIRKLEPKRLKELCGWIQEMSDFIEKECLNHDVRYFDVSKNYKDQIENAYKYLLDK